MIKEETINVLSRVFGILANYMDRYSGDLFIDFPRACQNYENEDYPIVFVHKSHADLIKRFTDICIERKIEPTYENSVNACKEALGIDFAIEITPSKLIITNYNADKSSIRSIVAHLKNIYDWKDAVEVIDNSRN